MTFGEMLQAKSAAAQETEAEVTLLAAAREYLISQGWNPLVIQSYAWVRFKGGHYELVLRFDGTKPETS